LYENNKEKKYIYLDLCVLRPWKKVPYIEPLHISRAVVFPSPGDFLVLLSSSGHSVGRNAGNLFICGSFNDAVSSSDCIAQNEKKWKEVVVATFEVLSQHTWTGSEKLQEALVRITSVLANVQAGYSLIQVTSVTA
jgi:hypothetical protein